MNKKQALNHGYTFTGQKGTDRAQMLAQVRAARDHEHHARLVTERVSPAEGSPKARVYAVYTKLVKRAARLQKGSAVPTTAPTDSNPPAANQEAPAAASAKARKAKAPPKAKKGAKS